MWKGFYSFDEARQLAITTLGFSYFLKQHTINLLNQNNAPSSSNFRFCDHCVSMTQNFKKLNDNFGKLQEDFTQLNKKYQQLLEDFDSDKEIIFNLKEELSAEKEDRMRCQGEIRMLKGKKAMAAPLAHSNNQFAPLENAENEGRVMSEQKFGVTIPRSITILDSFPKEIKSSIKLKAQKSGQQFHRFLFEKIIELADNPPRGLTVTFSTFYHNNLSKLCPKLEPNYKECPLQIKACPCYLILFFQSQY